MGFWRKRNFLCKNNQLFRGALKHIFILTIFKVTCEWLTVGLS